MKLSDRVFAQEETHSHGKRDLESGQNTRYAQNREENISKTRSSIEQEKKDYFEIIEKIEKNLPDKEKKFEYRRATSNLENAKAALALEDKKLENLEELESVLKEMGDDLFQIPEGENTHEIGHHGANLVRISQVNVLKEDVTSAKVKYGGKNQGLSYSGAQYGFVRTRDDKGEIQIIKKDTVDKIFTKTITSGLGQALRSKDPNIKKNAEVVVEMWNGFTDAERNGIDTFNVKQANENKMYSGSITVGGWAKRLYHKTEETPSSPEEEWLTRTSSLTVLIRSKDNTDQTRNTMLHEKTHRIFSIMDEESPEKVKKFTEDVIALGEEGAITQYALKFYQEYESYSKEIKDKIKKDPENADVYEEVLQKKAVLYANEFHSNFMGGIVAPTGSPIDGSDVIGYHDLNPKNIENANKLIKELYNNE